MIKKNWDRWKGNIYYIKTTNPSVPGTVQFDNELSNVTKFLLWTN